MMLSDNAYRHDIKKKLFQEYTMQLIIKKFVCSHFELFVFVAFLNIAFITDNKKLCPHCLNM
jgi:hypothetical protein